MRRITLIKNGGPGSGNFGHAGRPGERGGSAGGGSGMGSAKIRTAEGTLEKLKSARRWVTEAKIQLENETDPKRIEAKLAVVEKATQKRDALMKEYTEQTMIKPGDGSSFSSRVRSASSASDYSALGDDLAKQAEAETDPIRKLDLQSASKNARIAATQQKYADTPGNYAIGKQGMRNVKEARARMLVDLKRYESSVLAEARASMQFSKEVLSRVQGQERSKAITAATLRRPFLSNHQRKIVLHGGAGSGNFGHAGRPGERGGSGAGGGGSSSNLKLKEEKYSWGTLRKVEFGRGGSTGVAVIHPENYTAIKALDVGQSLTFKDEQKINWEVTRVAQSDYKFVATSRGHGMKGIVTIN